ncbi:hypothetical protein E2C00_19455 [Streptomyces sp. WAC05374]|uniref:hypothetical protein n=1 Tax=unclassified Streptomyces TaxID=2593676 RepID=UPI000F865CF4|nr:hypothetical protein [Streptomyces sp. WAC05374]RST02875.1 hypothetical protein EF905_34535 [Streptomyces sp. WAC05374]TDF37881.1 hypothetical protein E2B92_28660 [Streptomyces sp. WAC05374]TDF52737.1 hypothetical protein E2C02_20925 [Streptomyces sp. WAC05374]TDF54156.1 hypothetical protein E2C00_19455 [Streptomyces sp. WAC05374]
MRAIGAASAALLGAAALALTAPAPAVASGKYAPGDFAISPSTVQPGGRVVLTAPGCSGTAMASSGVFDTVTIPAGRSATATVDWDARRGAVYTVSFTCAGGTPGTVDLTIAPATSTPTTSSTAVPTVTTTRTVTPTAAPTQGVRGGVGGSIGGLNAGELAAGTGLVVAAATGIIYMLRRRAESRRH